MTNCDGFKIVEATQLPLLCQLEDNHDGDCDFGEAPEPVGGPQ